MSKVATLVHTPECPCLFTHYPACLEFLQGFTSFGFTITVATTLEQCKDSHILLLSSHRVDLPWLRLLNDENPSAVYILWHYHEFLPQLSFKNYILTGEYYHHPPRLPSHQGFYSLQATLNTYVPLKLMANEEPAKVGTYPKSHTLSGCFIGSPYKPHWVQSLPNVVYHNIHHGGLLSYDERRQLYLRSTIAFGFSNDGNISNWHPTQRNFEGLAYGCVVLSDNPAAVELTNGIIEYVGTEQECHQKFAYYLSHPEKCREKELQGYEWIRQYGTNRHIAQSFLDKMRELSYPIVSLACEEDMEESVQTM